MVVIFQLDAIFGTTTTPSEVKGGFMIPLPKMTNSDFSRLIRSEEISKAVRPPRKNEKKSKIHRNPLKKHALMVKLNPYASVMRRLATRASQPKKKEAAAVVK